MKNRRPSKVAGNFAQLEMLRATARQLLFPQLRKGPPFDPEQVAQSLGVSVIETEIRGALGYVETSGNTYQVYLKGSMPIERKRFTLGHELGHVVLMRAASDGRVVNLVRYRKTGCPPGLEMDPAEEALCNQFAAELLMPEHYVRAILHEYGDDPRAVFEVKTRFCVSLHAAATRLVTVKATPEIASISFWDCSTPWPTPQWWVGQPPRGRHEREAVEAMVRATDDDRARCDSWARVEGQGQRRKRRTHGKGVTVNRDVWLVRRGRWALACLRESFKRQGNAHDHAGLNGLSAFVRNGTGSVVTPASMGHWHQLGLDFD